MWLLTCDGDLFEGKRIWLRPGTTHLLGRTSGRMENGERVQYLNSKSVSRKHLTIAVGPVPKGDSAKIFTRSEIKLTDGSKLGTVLNGGQRLVQETKILDGKEYEIKLGSYEHLFHLVWRPVTLSFASGSKRFKDEALMGERRDVLEQADIKIISDYVTNETTHTVTKKRNTTAALQALLQARWVINEGFVEALYTSLRLDNAAGLAALEQEFDANWPSEENYITPAASEPQPRPDSFLKPNLDRAEVFHNYTFVFLAQAQYDNLLPVITSGGGKALCREVEVGTTTVAEVVEYIMEVAGRKHDRQFRLSQQTGSGGVVVVRMVERDEEGRVLMRSIDVALDQRSIEQSEFLDAILTVDASGMRRQLEELSVDDNANGNAEVRHDLHSQTPQRPVNVETYPPAAEEAPPPKSTSQANPAKDEEMQDQPASAAVRRKNRRIITQSRFKGFDDFDPSQFSRAASGSPEPSANNQGPSQTANGQYMDVNGPSQALRNQQNARKREREAQDEEDMYAAVLPSHAALKKRKTEAARRGEADPFADTTADAESAAAALPGKRKKMVKELDVRAEVQKRREAQEEQRRQDEESLRQAMEGVDIKELKNLAKVEEMEMPTRERAPRHDVNGDSVNNDRWDPAWNGRKNFKKFRRRGDQSDGPQLRRLIVTLEEVPRKGHGIGDEYWLTPSSVSTNAGSNRSKSQSQSQNTRSGANGGGSSRSQREAETADKDDETSRFRRRLQRSREEDEEAGIADDVRPEEIAGRARAQAIQDAVINATPSQTLVGDSQRKAGTVAAGKRPATQQGGTPAKRIKQTTLAPPSRTSRDEEDEDGLKFRRRR